jgi:outer membrane lipoprotein-sorting protein
MRLVLKNSRKTGAVSGAPPKELASPSPVWWRAAAPFALCTFSILASACCALGAETAETVLARMDKAAPSIHAMTAKVKMTEYTALLDDTGIETGTLQMQKVTPDDLRAILAFEGADKARTIFLMGKFVEIYYPVLNTYQRYDLGKQAAMADQLLLLGFGTSGSALAKSYDIKLAGSEKIDGQDTSELELSPKDPGVRATLAKVILWIPLDAGYPVQQQFFDPPKKGNWRKVTYSEIKLNPDIKGKLELKLPKGAKKQSD